MKRILCVLVCLILVFSLFAAGCGNNAVPEKKAEAADQSKDTAAKPSESKPAEKPAETITLKYWDTIDETTGQYRPTWTKENIDLFQKANPNIKIEFTNTPNGDQYLNKISTEMAANNAPDVSMTWVAGRLEPFVKAGRLLPLNDIIEKSPVLKETVNPGNLSSTTFGEKVYAIPLELAGEVVYYNKALFKKASLEVPKTWDELMNCIKVFKQNNIIPIAMGNKDPWPGTIPYMAIFNALNGADEYKKTAFDKQAVFNTDPYIKAAEYFSQLVKAGAFEPNFNSNDYNAGQALFSSGKAAMRFNGTWEMSSYIKELKDDLGVTNWVDMPNGKTPGADNWLLVQNNAYCISANTKVKDAAVKFMEFMMSKERQKPLIESGFSGACRNIPIDESKLHPIAAQIVKSLANAKNAELIWDVMLGQNIGKELNLSTQAIMAGADAKQVLEKLNKAAQAEWKQ